MLSRVAESLFWMARYMERAEDLTRLLSVNFNTILEARGLSAAGAWESIIRVTGDEQLFADLHPETTTGAVIDFLLWDPGNPNAVAGAITKARENARSVREQISTEMWEELNRLYFWVRDVDRASVTGNPHAFFNAVRDGSQAFQGVTLATMAHGEGYEFIRLGHHLERADKTIRILGAKYEHLATLPPESPDTALQLIALLRSCSAFEPFRRTRGATMEIGRVAEYLLLDRQLPRAVAFCIFRSIESLEKIAGPSARPEGARRTLGRLGSELEYMEIRELLDGRMDSQLDDLLAVVNQAGDEIASSYFDTRVIVEDRRPRQQQQQQQQQGAR